MRNVYKTIQGCNVRMAKNCLDNRDHLSFFDEGGIRGACPWCGYLGTVRRKGRKLISQPKDGMPILYSTLSGVSSFRG